MLDGVSADRLGEAGLCAVLRAGVDWLQVRDRALGGAALLDVVDRACHAARYVAGSNRVLVNRRVDVALAAGADGVHLGFDGLPATRARTLLGEEAWIGVSTHSPEEAARETGASYVQLAPIFPPLSKTSDRRPLGIAGLRAACGRGVPVLAQGGIEARNAASVIAAGAAGVAVTGAIGQSDDPERAGRALREALDA